MVTGVGKDGIVSFGKQPPKKAMGPHLPSEMDVDELFDKYVLDIEAVHVEQPPIPIRKSVRQRAVEAMRAHFDGSNSPVKLKPLGFSSEEVATLERAGLAYRGSMDSAEFGRWQASLKGLEPTTLPGRRVVVPPEEEKTKARYPYKKRRFKPRPVEGAEEEKAPPKPFTRLMRRHEKALLSTTAGVPVVGQTEARVIEERPEAVPQREPAHPPREEKRTGRITELRRELESLVPLEALGATEMEDWQIALELPYLATAAREAVEEIRAELAEEGRKETPLTLAREKLEAALERATGLYKEGKSTREQAQAKAIDAMHAWAQAWKKIHKAEEQERTGKTKGKSAEGMRKEDPESTTRLAYAEENKPEAEQKDKFLVQMAPHFRRLGKRKGLTDTLRQFHQDAVDALKAQRIAAQEKVDAAKLKQQLKTEARAAKERAKVEKALDKQVEKGVIDRETRDALLARDEEAAKKFKTRVTRERKSGPAIRKALKAISLPDWEAIRRLALNEPTRLPQARKGESSKRPKVERVFYVKMQEAVRAFVADVTAELKAAGVELPTKASRFFNTPEENAVIFLKHIIRKFGKAGESRGPRQGLVDTSIELKSLGLRDYIHKGLNWYDAHNAIFFMQEHAKTGGRAVERRQQMVDALNGLIFDAAKTKETVEAKGMRTAAIEKAEAEEEEFGAGMEDVQPEEFFPTLAGETVEESQHRELAEGIRRLAAKWNVKPLGSPTGRIGGFQKGAPIKSTTVKHAISDWMKGWEKLAGAPTGWQRQLHKLMLAAAEHLIPDMEVHFVDEFGDLQPAGPAQPGHLRRRQEPDDPAQQPAAGPSGAARRDVNA